jgi:PAS domain S-box-containing protein
MGPPAHVLAPTVSATGAATLVPWDSCRLLVDGVDDYAIFMLDREGRIGTWNRGAETIHGFNGSEIIGTHFSRLFPPADVEAGHPDRDLARAREAGRTEGEAWRIRKDASRFWASFVLTAFHDDRGDVCGFGAVIRDAARHRSGERPGLAVEARLEELLDAVTDYAVVMLDATGHVTTWNGGARQVHGYDSTEIVGKHFSVFHTAEDRAARKPDDILGVVERDGRWEKEGWRVRKDGSRFWASVVITCVRDRDGQLRGFAEVTRELPRREQVGRQERGSVAGEITGKLEELLAVLSHELRTPLNAILGWSSLLRTRGAGPFAGRAIEAIHRNAQTQVMILEELLDVHRIATGTLRLQVRPAELMMILSEAIEAVRPTALARQVDISLQSATDSSALLGDSRRLRQVFCILLSNAVRSSDSRGKVVVSIERQRDRWNVSVRDSGRGIEPELLPFVFDSYRRSDDLTMHPYGGLGLGLPAVRQIVELHGGAVHVESAGRGTGSLFRIVLPIRAVMQDFEPHVGVQAAQAPTASQWESLQGLRVLVVDDDADARELLCHVLGAQGAIVETAESANGGLDALRSFRPDVLVSDIAMPGEDGYSLVRRVRALTLAEGGGVPSIALSAFSRDEDRVSALAAGFSMHIAKPVNPAALTTAVARLAADARR